MKYYRVNVVIEIQDEDHSGWDSSCDETFHGPGKLHLPDQGVYVTAYAGVDKSYFDMVKHTIFDEFGGI